MSALSQRRSAPLARVLLSIFGLGFAPFAPGTVASLACAGLLWVCGSPLWGIVASIVLGSAITLGFGRTVTDTTGHTGDGDPGWVVADEWAGQALAGIALPMLGTGNLTVGWLVAFGAFRLLDITKVGPVGLLERIPGPWGVLLDDLAAGAIAAIVAGAAALLI